MTYISLTDNYDNLKIGTDISINEFLRTNFLENPTTLVIII